MFTWKAVRLGLTGTLTLVALALFAYSPQGGVPISYASNDAHQEGNYKITLRCGTANVEVPLGYLRIRQIPPLRRETGQKPIPPALSYRVLRVA